MTIQMSYKCHSTIRRDKKILLFPVTFQDFVWSVGRKKSFQKKNLHVNLGKQEEMNRSPKSAKSVILTQSSKLQQF